MLLNSIFIVFMLISLTNSYQNGKKGFVYSLTANNSKNIFDSLNLNWYYNWNYKPVINLDLPYIPMIWGSKTFN